MPAPKPLAKGFSSLHRLVYRASGGRWGKAALGYHRPSLLLTTKGRRSGEGQATPLLYIEDGQNLVVAASNHGQDEPPAWWLNLQEAPVAEVQIGKERHHVRAREAEEDEREKLWEQLVEHNPDYETHQEKADRQIPVVVLEPED